MLHSKALLTWALLMTMALSVSAQDPKPPEKIQRIDIVHMTHTDIGFTDHPLVCRRQQMRFLDIAIDAVLATNEAPPEGQFYWTAETTLAVDDWWQQADETRREDFLKAVGTGRLEIAALAMNQTPTLNPAQWQTTLHWLPDDLWDKVQPRAAVQNDVNGFPRAGAMALLDRDVDKLLMGINSTNGGPPMDRPTAFWWKMPDGRKMFVWLGDHYVSGFYYLHPATWRRGPVPESTDTRYRPPRRNELFRTDEASVRAAHAHLLGKLAALEAKGYAYPSLVVSVTNEWRVDNDPPFPPMADFVAAWKKLDLKPELHLSTVADALERMKGEIGDTIPEHEGEWTDWWANGCASGPREVAASRRAKRLVAAAVSPVWGPVDQPSCEASEEIYRDLCLFDEHTWGASDSIGQPHSLDTWAQYNEKSRVAYRPMALAKLLLAQRARTAIYDREDGLYVANTAPLPWSGWIEMPSSCLRGDFHSLEDPETGKHTPLEPRHGYRPHSRPAGEHELTAENGSETFPDNCPNQVTRFWVDGLDGHSIQRFGLSEDKLDAGPKPYPVKTTLDHHGWPKAATWAGMEHPLFKDGTGDFLSVAIDGFGGRWTYADIHHIGDPAQRSKRRAETLKTEIAAVAGDTTCEQNAHTTIYTQSMKHSRLKWLTRRLELWNEEPRARLTIRFHRTESELPEIFFVANAIPCNESLPTVSNGGLPFVPFEDQLPGTCREYFSIDGWAHYQSPAGRWLWVTRDAPLVTFGDHQVLARNDAPENPGRILTMVFNNVWFTNFLADSHGAMEFQFDLAWQAPSAAPVDPSAQATTLLSEPQVVINPDLPESPIFMNRLHRP
jgi:glycosyl hydrolase family 38